MRVIIDGEHHDALTASISVFDLGLQRGDGCFEAIRAYGGRGFRVEDHLDRLAGSASRLDIRLPERADLRRWVDEMAEAGGDCIVRVFVTRGSVDLRVPEPPRTIVLWEPVPDLPQAIGLLPLPAPWHAAGVRFELSGVKSISYGPNIAATRAAQARGYDDALLLDRNGVVLEGPTSSVAWVTPDGVLETAELGLGVLDSITRRVALEDAATMGITVREGVYPLDRLLSASEVLVLSTVKEVRPVDRVGDAAFEPGAVTGKLAGAYRDRIARGT